MRITTATNTAALVFSFLVAESAFSADAPTQEPLIPQAPETTIDTSQWGGFYLGVYGGYSWISAGGLNAASGDTEGNGEKLGAFGGYNWQFDNNVLTGLEVLGGYANSEETDNGITLEQYWDASVRARLGYALDGSVIYSFAGLALTSVDAQAVTGSDSQTLSGYTLGLGLETQLTDSLIGRIEYGYSDFDSENFALGNANSNNIDFQDQTINLGVGFKF